MPDSPVPSGRLAYPTGAEISAELTAHGITVSANQANLLDGKALAGRLEFERDCHRVFLGKGSTEERKFDPPTVDSGRLYIEDLASVSTVKFKPLNSATITYDIDDDFFTLPENYSELGVPITAIEFSRRWVAPTRRYLRRSILITGEWGYATAANGFPELAWQAMLAAGLGNAWAMVTHNETGGLLSWKEGEITEDFGVFPWSRLLDAWRKTYTNGLKLYRRWEI